MTILKAIILLSFALITYQDIKDRMVWWWLFLTLGGILGYTYYSRISVWSIYAYSILANLLLISTIILILYLFSKLILRKAFFKEAFGLGDLLFFFAIALGFPTVTFIVLFSFSILFSLVIHLILNRKHKYKYVPLAGYMSAFFSIVYFCNLVFNYPNLYLL